MSDVKAMIIACISEEGDKKAEQRLRISLNMHGFAIYLVSQKLQYELKIENMYFSSQWFPL